MTYIFLLFIKMKKNGGMEMMNPIPTIIEGGAKYHELKRCGDLMEEWGGLSFCAYPINKKKLKVVAFKMLHKNHNST